MSQMKVVFATSSCMVQVGPGNNIQIQEGDVWRASDPVVRAHRELFTDDPRKVLKVSVPFDDDETYADTTKSQAMEQLERDLATARARVAELEAGAVETVDGKTHVGEIPASAAVTEVNEDLASAPPVEGYRTEAEAAAAEAESKEGVSVEAPVEGYRTEAEAAKAEAESEKGVAKAQPVEGYRTKAEAAEAEAESKEDVASVETQAPVEQATRAPGEKRNTRRNRA